MPYDDRRLVEEASGQPLVPVLVDGDATIADSPLILAYLDERQPDPPLFPRDPARRAAGPGSRSSGDPPDRGQGPQPSTAVEVPLSVRTVPTLARRHTRQSKALQNAKGRVTSVVPLSDTNKAPAPGLGAAGQGFEPQLPDPESGVLPLDDPATVRRPIVADRFVRRRACRPARGSSRPRCRCARSPRRTARDPTRAALPSATRPPGRGRTSCSSGSRS